MKDKNITEKVRDAISFSTEEAQRLHSNFVGVEHMVLGLLRVGKGKAIDTMAYLGLEVIDLKRSIEKAIAEHGEKSNTKQEIIPFTKQAAYSLKKMHLEAQVEKSTQVDTSHLMLAILHDENNFITRHLENKGINYKNFSQAAKNKNIPQEAATFDMLDDVDSHDDIESNKSDDVYAAKTNDGKNHNRQTPALDTFGKDLTKAAEENKLDPIVGREKELERIAQILSRRKKNNPILIGEPGVGKSAIAEGLAIRIIQRKVPRILFDKRIISLDIASIVAGTKYRGQFEERMKTILNELEKNPDIILFIDEIHTIVGAGNASGSLDASNMFKPALARGEIQCIGATTHEEYRQNIEKDGALERRFQKVTISPTTIEETIEILNNIKEHYEEHHSVQYSDEAIKACVILTDRYITDRALPDKAIDAMDEVGAKAHINNMVHVPDNILKIEQEVEEINKLKRQAVVNHEYTEAANHRDIERILAKQLEDAKKNWYDNLKNNKIKVTEDQVAEVVSAMSGVPIQKVSKDEKHKLISIEDALKSTVIGQNIAIDKIVRAIRRNRAGLKDPNKPIGSFMFLGPTGVGKTFLAKMLAKYMFDSENALIRVDMSEYMEKFAVSRLIGAPPGYVGYEEGGQLTEKIRRRPYSIILLDEIEKAHPDVFNLLLQVLDDGMLTDSMGRKVDFKNTIIIMTSNIGSRQLKDFGMGVGFNTSAKESGKTAYTESVIENALKKAFAPEFLNRVDDIIVFENLNRENIHKIIDIELKGFYERLKKLGVKMAITEKAKDFITEKGWDPDFGARPLKRAIQKYLEDPLSEEIININLKEGQKIKADYDAKKDEIKFKIS